MEEVLRELNKLRLDNLIEEWVQAIYESEFLEFSEIPADYENSVEYVDIKSVFHSAMNAIDAWLNTNLDNEEERSWTVLSHQIKHQHLLALLAYYIDFGGKNVVSREHRNNAIHASRLYYKLLCIPGYKAYNIYHSQLFTHSLVCLNYPKAMCDNEENYFNAKELTCEVNSVIKELGYFVNDLRQIIQNLHLTSNDMNFEDIVSNLVDITGGAIVNKLNIDKIELAKLSGVIYEMIDVLVCEANGEPNSAAIQLLFKCLLPKFIAASVDCRHVNNVVRASYVTYSGLLLTKFGKAALPGYVVLLEHLCYTLDGLEKAEVRSARVSLVVGLMSLLPRKSYGNYVKWLLKLSTTAKVPHRQIALEMLAKLLNNDPDLSTPDHSSEKENIPSLLGTTIGETTEEPNQNVQEDNAIDENNLESQPGTSQSITTEIESIQNLPTDNQDETEEDVAGLLRQRTHTIVHAEVLRAVYERVHDVSSTLRTRALALLADCLTSEHPAMKEAIKELNGAGAVSRLAAVGARCVCDERAVVRKAAAGLLHRLLADMLHDARMPQDSDYAMLVGLCRDASIVVRVSAVGALGELAASAAHRAALDAFLAGPMHRLSDPETKIQDQVVALIQQLLIERIRKYDALVTEDPLPWEFLAGITRHNMKRHLQKACALLAKSSNCINHRLVDLLSTHLGILNDERDLQCLVLLTSISRHVDYSDVGFLLDYYYNLTEKPERDARLVPLTLELLATWSARVGGEARAALRDHLVTRLAAAVDDGSRTASASLAAQLDPENLQWATELMQISERRALESGAGDVREWVRAADVSLVAPAPPSPQLLRLFLAALAQPPPEWGDEERGLCAAGAGRLCVRSRDAAAALAPSLAALLRDDAAPLCARLNALLALTDICTRYSCIVEPQLDSVCGCVAPQAAPPLRRAAARALTRLLLAGYLRLRTPLYYRYCALLADEDHDVREPAEYYVSCCLTVDTIYHHFVDCVLHYNNQESESISFDARQLIYDVMLQRMSLVQKLNVQCRLAREVLEHAGALCDDGDELSAALNAALLDTITLLCGPRMKLPKKPEKAGDADIDDLQERVTTNIVSHKMKRTVAEVLVPAVLRLYAHMRPRGGQLAAYLVRIATDLLNDYRHEIEELIENDEELVERVQQFQETIGLEASFGNTRNLVTASAPPEPDTPRARKRPRPYAHSPRKRALRI
ncbi:condensin-2 complex subunit D3-like isoform X2 [Vanessa atalanta]|uniref:condensin-2 complex subunit D3-like isoform X2 n=1 Tax=Vanessa atalanta TaxID=42275 RepID=UPI001FCCE8AA|nr:condensin-2 complex subunit D3-like isoform X2 [Vanessa atalanta]